MRFWVSWVCAEEDHRPVFKPNKGDTLMANEPRVLGWWCSGDSDGGAVLCALMEVLLEGEAKAVVKKYWPEFNGEWRFCEEREPGWTPGSRFPMGG